MIVDRLSMPARVAGYLRGYADAMEFQCALGAGVEGSPDDVVNARVGHLAAYLCEPPSARAADVSEQRRTIEIASGKGLFTVASWHEDAEAYSANRRGTGLQDARSAIQAGRAGGIVVADLARLGRNSLDVLDLLERSNVEGWRVIALDCRLDSATPAGALVVEALRYARRDEWRKVPGSRRQRETHPDTSRNPSTPTTLGAVEPSVAERIAAMRMDGNSYRAIAARLTALGIPGPGGADWGPASVRAVLQATRTRRAPS